MKDKKNGRVSFRSSSDDEDRIKFLEHCMGIDSSKIIRQLIIELSTNYGYPDSWECEHCGAIHTGKKPE